MSSTPQPASLFIVALVVALALAYRPFGDYMYRVVTGDQALPGRARHLPGDRRQPGRRAAWARLRPQRAGVLGGVDPVPVRASSGCRATCCSSLGFPQRHAGAVLEHRGQLRHEHELAGVLGRVDDGLPGPDGRPGGAELRLGRGRHRRRRRAGARLRPQADAEQLGNFWVDLVRIVVRILLPIAVDRRDRVRRRRHDPELLLRHRRAHAGRRRPSTSPAARWPARRSSRSSAPTAAASTTPTPRTRSRTRRRGPTGCEIFLLLVISFSLPRTFGRMVGSNKQGYAIVAAMAIMAIGSVIVLNVLQGAHGGTVPQAVGAATEGTETRFGVLALGDVRECHDADLDRCGGLVPRLLHRARRRRHDARHDARRGRARRHRLRPVRHARSWPSITVFVPG